MAWDDILACPLRLADGTTLHTLKDAGYLIAANFATARHSPPLQDAIVLLMRASISGQASDIEAATEEVNAVVRLWKLDGVAGVASHGIDVPGTNSPGSELRI